MLTVASKVAPGHRSAEGEALPWQRLQHMGVGVEVGAGRALQDVMREEEGRGQEQSGPTGNKPSANVLGTQLLKTVMC